MYINILGAEILICGDKPQESVPVCDLIFEKEEYALVEEGGSQVQICFGKADNKISTYSLGDLQISLKDGIISLKKLG